MLPEGRHAIKENACKKQKTHASVNRLWGED